ncbi:FAD-dependent oxidoreductase [Mycolicibacterium moriokaense]|nr:FAD-dependent oxidoreductase [Mycolicibacterium moriokaense]
MTGTRTHVIVIGGGYAGTFAANHLRLRNDIDITLINPRPRFVERIRLHQLVAGNHDATADYGSLLGEGINLVVDSATKINTSVRTVEFASGRRPLRYDYVIYAVGSTGAVPAIPGAEFAYPLSEFEYAQRLRDAVAELHPDAPVTVVGAGLTGIEMASELAEQGRAVTLVCGGQLAPSVSEPARGSIAKWMAKHGVAVLTDDVVTEVRKDAVVFADGAVRPSALTIWTAGFGVPPLAADSGLRTDALGRLLTDETLTSVDDGRVVAAGDCAAPSNLPLRMSCQAAGPLGLQAAETVLSRIAATEPDAIEPVFLAQCISLGRRGATLQPTRRDDSPKNYYLGGRLVASVKEAICKGTLWGLRREAHKPGSAFMFSGDKRSVAAVTDAARVVTNP